jgi:hypothetical protein
MGVYADLKYRRGIYAKAHGWAKVVRNMDVYFANDPGLKDGAFQGWLSF